MSFSEQLKTEHREQAERTFQVYRKLLTKVGTGGKFAKGEDAELKSAVTTLGYSVERVEMDEQAITKAAGLEKDASPLATAAWSGFFAAWWEQHQDAIVSTDEVYASLLASAPDMYGAQAADPTPWPEPLAVHRDKGAGSIKRSLGRSLSRLSDRLFNGRKLKATIDGHDKAKRWQLCGVSGVINYQNIDNTADNTAYGGEQ